VSVLRLIGTRLSHGGYLLHEFVLHGDGCGFGTIGRT
jgi:hypothetical protein